MERAPVTFSVSDVRHLFVDIEFPEYQREPDVWSREQKQRLIDSILRKFDIASIYLYEREDKGLECIDGRQRLNAIMSFLGLNPSDPDNGFALRIENEISSALVSEYSSLDGHSFADLESAGSELAAEAVAGVLGYDMTFVYLSGAVEPDEFNLQFLRLNLGTLINAGEKLHAMVGNMRDLLFESPRVGRHPFFNRVGIPTRRYAKEQTAAQVLLQAFSRRNTGEFTRARHFDLQRFLKTFAEIPNDDPTVGEVSRTLDSLEATMGTAGDLLRNRAMTVSVVLVSWAEGVYAKEGLDIEFAQFLPIFLGRLRWQVGNMKTFNVDEHYLYLVEFQRHLTQASVEKPAVTQRHEILVREWNHWIDEGDLTGDAEYKAETGQDPPSVTGG